MAFQSPWLYVDTVGDEVYSYSVDGTEEVPGERWRQKVGSHVEGIVPTDNGIVVSTFGGPLQNLRDRATAGITGWTAKERHTGSPLVHAGSWVYSTGWDSLSSLRVYDMNLHWRVGADFGNAAPVDAGDTISAPVKDEIHAFNLSGGVGIEDSRSVPSGGRTPSRAVAFRDSPSAMARCSSPVNHTTRTIRPWCVSKRPD